jgi:NNP family nitrate/nitrite transporter-like MFS transporter
MAATHVITHWDPEDSAFWSRQTAPNNPTAQAQATRDANCEAAAALGFASAIGAYGGFFIPKSYGTSISLTGGPEATLVVFIVFYLSCIAITWWTYSRRFAPMPC